MRLDKFLSLAGAGTRTEVKKLLRSGRVRMEGCAQLKPEQKIDPDMDVLYLDGKRIGYEETVWYMLHKAAGCISAVSDPRFPTVMDALDKRARSRSGLFPVGRLDRDTEGLLLITDDGELAHRLLSPAFHVPKTYFALVTGSGPLGREEIAAFREGLDIGEEKPAKGADLSILEWREEYLQLSASADSLKDGGGREKGTAGPPVWSAAELVLCEGRYHQVKRMFAARGFCVEYLKRISFGPLRLDPMLERGRARRLTKEEVGELAKAAQRKSADASLQRSAVRRGLLRK